MDLEQPVNRTLFEQFRRCEWLINVQQSFPQSKSIENCFPQKITPKNQPRPSSFQPKTFGKVSRWPSLPNEKKKNGCGRKGWRQNTVSRKTLQSSRCILIPIYSKTGSAPLQRAHMNRSFITKQL